MRSRARGECKGIGLLSAFASAAVLLVACGDDGGGGESDFAAEAEAICVDAAREQADVSIESSDFADRLDASASAGAEAQERSEALIPPDDLDDTWDRYLDNRSQSLELVDEIAAAVDDGDTGAAEAGVAEIEALVDDRDELAEELGLEACARNLPDEDEQQIREAVELASTSNDGDRVCEEVVSDAYIDRQFDGDVDACAKAQSRSVTVESVEFEDIDGVAGVLATVEVDLSGGSLDGRSGTLQLVYEDGAWRVLETSVGEAPEAG
ncbi:MAG: hypothetical protein R2718_08945 [Solirubrobacterales bacterium]|nr:hypothetical protein [Solirubrobacterales bacterium]